MKDISIRLATRKDVLAIIDLNRDGLRHYPWAYDRDYITRAVVYGNYYVLDIGQVIGAIKFFLRKKYLWISTVVVSKEFRGNGYGRRLMNFADWVARKHKYDRILLDTLTISRVGKFHKAMGYKMVEEGLCEDGKKYCMYEKIMH